MEMKWPDMTRNEEMGMTFFRNEEWKWTKSQEMKMKWTVLAKMKNKNKNCIEMGMAGPFRIEQAWLQAQYHTPCVYPRHSYHYWQSSGDVIRQCEINMRQSNYHCKTRNHQKCKL